MTINACLSIITLNVNGLTAPIKRHRMASWIIKEKLTICCLQEIHCRVKNAHRLKVRGMEKDISCKWRQQEGRGSNTHIIKNKRPQRETKTGIT